jgi:hypothetical protein
VVGCLAGRGVAGVGVCEWLCGGGGGGGAGPPAVKHTGGLCPDPRCMRQVGNTLRVAAIVRVFL